MTHAIKNRIPLFFCCLFAFGYAASGQERTSEITSNDIWRLAGGGDTLWMATSKGVNYTAGAKNDPISWRGYTGILCWSLAFGDGKLLGCMVKEQQAYTHLWMYDHFSDSEKEIVIIYNLTGRDSIGYDFRAFETAWSPGSFWVACVDAGLLRLDASGSDTAVYFPGMDKTSFSLQNFPPNSFPSTPDPALQAVSVAVDDSGMVWLACRKRLWSFNPSDTTWRSCNDSVSVDVNVSGNLWNFVTDTVYTVEEYMDIEVRSGGSSAVVFATVVKEIDTDTSFMLDTCLYKFDNRTRRWKRFLSVDTDVPTDVAAGSGDIVYVVHSNQINLYRDTLPDSLPPHSRAVIPGGEFQQYRFPAGIDYPEINNILYLADEEDTLFWVATSNGLFYSLDEHGDEAGRTPFLRAFREKSLKAGLDEVYAYPSILNDYTAERSVFAYNLDENDYVTIDIYDFNMDRVCRVVDSQYRYAGKNRTDGSGRSTDETKDCWDGTFNNHGGKPVAPGVYYFRIKTKKGTRAFGKIIVAKSGG